MGACHVVSALMTSASFEGNITGVEAKFLEVMQGTAAEQPMRDRGMHCWR